MFQTYVALGRTTSDLRLNFTGGGVAVANFDLAINKPNAETVFIPCVVWKDKAKEYRDSIGKGSLILIEGEWKSYYHKKENGEKEPFLQVEITDCKIVEKKSIESESDKEN